MKFRCERDVLLEALTTASRAVSSRGGSLPVLSGLLLELTGDNRAAAAEMLGLSRQSLYVKLKRFGVGDAVLEN